MNLVVNRLNSLNSLLAYPAERLQDLALAGLRLYASSIFFPAGVSKIENWDVTLFLFESEYQVPFLSPVLAAWLGTAGELVLPVLLALGLLGRFSAAGLFVVNIVAVISLSAIEPAALAHHFLWGFALSVLMLWGPGRLSVDQVIRLVSARKRSGAELLS